MYTGLFDWDGFIYHAAFAAQKVIRHVTVIGEDAVHASFDCAQDMHEWRKECDLTMEEIDVQEELILKSKGFSIKFMQTQLNRVADYLHLDRCELYISGDNNFRNLLYDQYKANRTRPKPVHLQDVRDYSIKHLGAKVVDGMEADDALTIRAGELEKSGEGWVIVSADKDLRTFPGEHYDPRKGDYAVVDPTEAAFNFYSQVLTGDTADNIPGLHRVGTATAAKLLEDCCEPEEMWEICKREYALRDIPEKDLIRNAQLLHMLRHASDLWRPPT